VFAGTRATYEFTLQLYFSDALSDEIYATEPYASRRGRRVRNAEDRIFTGGGTGAQLMVEISREGDGLAGTFDVGLQLL
jgi:hypothetical protein